MAHPITRMAVLDGTCAQEAWTYFGYTTETGYALLANLGFLSCPQPLGVPLIKDQPPVAPPPLHLLIIKIILGGGSESISL